MLTSTKKLTRVGSYSKGIVIPSEWLQLLTGVELFNMEFDEFNRSIMLRPVTRGSSHTPNYGAPNDYTPQPRKAYPPSPLPTHTPAQWAKIPEHRKQGLIDHYELEQAMRAQGLNPNNERDVEKYNFAVKNRHLAATDFSAMPYELQSRYLDYVGQYIDNPHNDKAARLEWLSIYNQSLTVSDNDAKIMIKKAITDLLHKYAEEDDEL